MWHVSRDTLDIKFHNCCNSPDCTQPQFDSCRNSEVWSVSIQLSWECLLEITLQLLKFVTSILNSCSWPGEGELLDALPEEVLLVHGVSVLLPPHKLVNQLPLNPKGDERRLGGRIFWSFSYCFSMSLTIIMHNLEIFSYFRLRIFPYTSLTSYFDFWILCQK